MRPLGTRRPRAPRGRAAAAAALLLAIAPALRAQPVPAPAGPTWRDAAPVAPASSPRTPDLAAPWRAPAAVAQDTTPRARSASWWAALASAAVPGAGQVMLRQPRGIVYAALEAYMWLEYREAKRFSDRQRAEYRRIAREVARRAAPGPFPDGDWDYYERLEKLCTNVFPYATRCPSSGVFDAIPGGDVDPETDITTYNGQIWAHARDLFWLDPEVAPPPNSPEYNNALAYYRSRAERPEFYWSWVDQQASHDNYRRTIASANAAGREATRDLQLIAANHVLSMVDAFVTVRIRRYGRPGGRGLDARRAGLEVTVPWAPFGRGTR